jgi:signal transduction histidine kinase
MGFAPATSLRPHAGRSNASAERMSLQDEADQLARELFETRSRLRASGRALHDQVGPLLSAAGIRLDLLRGDHPQAAGAVHQTLLALEEAMERVRALSRELNPPPAAHLGLKKALASLVESHAETFAGPLRFSYTATAELPEDASAALYEASAAVLTRAVSDGSATRIALKASGPRNLIVKIESNGRGRWPRAALAAIERRVRPAGIILAATTKQSTIVWIKYAPRRPARG